MRTKIALFALLGVITAAILIFPVSIPKAIPAGSIDCVLCLDVSPSMAAETPAMVLITRNFGKDLDIKRVKAKTAGEAFQEVAPSLKTPEAAVYFPKPAEKGEAALITSILANETTVTYSPARTFRFEIPKHAIMRGGKP